MIWSYINIKTLLNTASMDCGREGGSWPGYISVSSYLPTATVLHQTACAFPTTVNDKMCSTSASEQNEHNIIALFLRSSGIS